MLVTLKEYAEIVGVSYSAVRHAVARGRLKPDKRIGNSWYIDSETEYALRQSIHQPQYHVYPPELRGMSNTRLNNIWKCMRQRCNNPKHGRYADYGGRGISVCEEWNDSFPNFYYWAISHGYRDDLSIDRINVDGNYEPDNCRWATVKEQANNKRIKKREPQRETKRKSRQKAQREYRYRPRYTEVDLYVLKMLGYKV